MLASGATGRQPIPQRCEVPGTGTGVSSSLSLAGPLSDRAPRKTVCEDGPAGLRVEAKRAVWSRFERNPARMATRVWALFVLDEWCRRHL